MGSGVGHFASVFGSRVCLLVLNLGVQSCLCWTLGLPGRGSYAVCLLFTTLLTLIFVVGCDITSVFFVSSKRFNLSEGIINSLIFGGIGSAVAVLAGLLMMELPLTFFEKATRLEFHLALAMIPVTLFASTLTQLLTSVSQFTWFAIVSILNVTAQLLLTVAFVWALSWGVAGALTALFVAGLLTIIVVLVLFQTKFGLTWVRPSLKGLWEMFHYGARYYVGRIGNNANFYVGTILLALFASKEEIGLFTLATHIAVRTMIIPDTLTVVLVPKVAGGSVSHDLIAQCARLVAVTSGILLLILAVFAETIVMFIFPPEFLAVAGLIQILAVGVVVRSACKVFVPYLLGTDRPGIASLSTVLGAGVNIAVLWYLLPILGISGAAIAMVAGWFAGSALLTAAFVRFSKLRLWEIWRPRISDWNVILNSIERIRQKSD